MHWYKSIKGRVRLSEPLSKHTSFKIGGPAKYFIEPTDYRDLQSVLLLLKKRRIPFSVIGSGSNILASDKGVERAILHLGSAYFKRLKIKGNLIEAGAGVGLSELVLRSRRKGLAGFEFLAGIPGSVGGGLVMNAGAWGENLGDLVEKVKIMDYNGRVGILNIRDLRFGYRKSSLSSCIVLEAVLRFSKAERRAVQKRIRENFSRRRLSQDLGGPSAGSVFINPPKRFAGALIEVCGLKGRSYRGAMISNKHANFILNRREASSSDVLKLMDLAIKRVKAKFNIDLRPEIKIWG